MSHFGKAQTPRRVEDARLLKGAGRYLDDFVLPRQTYAAFVRSPHGHADIRSIDTSAAAAMPGVFGVFTGDDLAKAGIGNVPCMAPLKNRDGSTVKTPDRPALARGRVRFAGEAVVLVVADTPENARDAAEAVAIDYAPLPAAGDLRAAIQPSAPQVWNHVKGNVAFDWSIGDEEKTKALFAKAAHTVELDIVNNRLVPNSMEPRGAIADYARGEDRLTLYCSTQGGYGMRKVIAGEILKIPESKLRVVTGDVGGGFGMKIFVFPEYVACLHAARVLERPVRWISDRSEAFLADTHGRDNIAKARVAVDANGKMTALHVSTYANLGAYCSQYSTFVATAAGNTMLVGVYAFEAALAEVKGIYSNTAPVDAFRGAGRPEANYVVERMIDAVGKKLGIDAAEIRRRNFIPPSAMPYKTALGNTYDSGHYVQNLDDAVARADVKGFEARREASKKAGKLRGLGIAMYTEICGGGGDETANIQFDPSGGAIVKVGNQSNGQGHETAYAQLVSEHLGIPMDKVRVIQGDTDVTIYSGMTGGSRALAVTGTAVTLAVKDVIARGRKLAAHLMEAAEADIEFADGSFKVAGTDKALTVAQLAYNAHTKSKLPPDQPVGLQGDGTFLPGGATFPNGCHIAEIEIDPDTGGVSFQRYTIVDDFGNVLNPMMLEGQVHGGTIQGIGQALYESCEYDPATGQLLSGSYMDYAMPRADRMPTIDFSYNEVPCKNNPLGVKGAGEAGTIGAPPAVIHAVLDALKPYGVAHIDMPATPQKIWRLIHKA
ncbi:MAG: xanthine dehydrogenase family protein molybdopterin-binding subunit [Rhodospirillales bacterium]|nr:xanthine dehydrogenase family protein molybdopterin-binding subunit [Rhodospirillales bacterium]